MSDPVIPIRPILEYFGFTLRDLPGKVKCEFHDDTVASAQWSELHYFCHACDAGGDAVRLLHDYDGLEWPDAYTKAESLAGAAGVSLAKPSGGGSGVSGKPGLRGKNRPRASTRIRG